MTDQDKQANRISILLYLMVASTYNTDYCASELIQTPNVGKVVRQEVRMLFNQLRAVNERLMVSMQKQLTLPDVDGLNDLSDCLIQAGFCLTTATPEQRKRLIEQMVVTLEEELKTAA